jgi:hypothetical protein
VRTAERAEYDLSRGGILDMPNRVAFRTAVQKLPPEA